MIDFIQKISIGLPGFLFAIVFHEWAHARMALYFGDDTAKYSGRLSLNPIAHYDLVGTIIFPAICLMIGGGTMFGWAKPVPVDPRRFKNVKKGIFWVSFAGPLANIILAVASAFLMVVVMRFFSGSFAFSEQVILILQQSIFINIILAVFNLIPFPPLDGSKMVSSFLDYESARKYESLQQFSFLFIILLWTTDIFSYLIRPALYLGNSVIYFFANLVG